MDRSDPEAMAAERHQDRLDEDADARDQYRWSCGMSALGGSVIRTWNGGTEEQALEHLLELAEQHAPTGEGLPEPQRTAWQDFHAELGDLTLDGEEEVSLVDPNGARYWLVED